ncbi:putative cytochrome c biosynthesis protein [Capsicum annuum]|nr:putative cytochrome c biosynthesis protein [Capsicum annuum]
MRKDAAKKNGTLFRSVGCLGSRITSELFTLKFKYVGAKCYLALLLRSNRSLLMLLRRRFFALSSLWTGALMDTRREQAKRVVRNGKKDTTTSPLCWTAGANTVVSDQDQEPIRIWILTCRWVLTVGILPGSWWAYHELGQGGWWFRDPIENASFMPRIASSRSLFATDDTRGIFLWQFFLLMTDISMILFSQMKQQALVVVFTSGWRLDIHREWVIHRAGTLITTVRPTPASILAECGTGSFHGNTTSTAASQYSLAPMYVTQFTGPENLHLGACLVPGETVNFAKARGPLLLCLKLSISRSFDGHKEIVLVATTKPIEQGLAPQQVYKQDSDWHFISYALPPHVDLAFNSVEHIMRDVEGGWLLRYMHANGASTSLLHLAALHQYGSNNPLGVHSEMDKIASYPYFYVKDLVGWVAFAIFFAIWVFYAPNVLGHPDNYIPANPMSTPPHIVLEWHVPDTILVKEVPCLLFCYWASADFLLYAHRLNQPRARLDSSTLKKSGTFSLPYRLFSADQQHSLKWQSFSLACTRDPKEVDFEPAYAKQRSQHPRPWGLVTGLMDAIISWEFFSLWLTGRGHNFLMRIQPARAISSVADAENRHSILCFPSTDLSGRMLESALLQLVVFKSEIAFTSHMKSVPTDFFGNQLAPSSSGDAARLRSHLSSLPQSTLRKRQVQLLYFRVDPASFRVSIRAGVLSDLVMSFSRSLLL